MIDNLQELYEILNQKMSHRKWWDTDNPWEIAIGAVLVQNTNWKNVDYSLANLKAETNLQPESIVALNNDRLEELIRPSGFYKNKSKTLYGLFNWLKEDDFDLSVYDQLDKTLLREKLLAISGIGPETADVLLVYVFNRPMFIADRYAQRIFQNLGLKGTLNYSKLQAKVLLPPNFSYQQAQNLHGWLIDYGQVHLKSDEAWQQGYLSNFKLNIIE
ncbi:endonuclease III domain-containing protein [Enterococcus sp. HY326]|uniref:endonuclease III domain-containing protein n=1 Tax=Enterococcus sp. HY326 TaxID=2971265 RepID=UPI0022409E2F|nr:deoxyribonuclease I [Enterococcus sp. HY326]